LSDSDDWSRHVRTCGCSVLVKLEHLCLTLIEVLPGVGRLVFERFDKAVEADGDEGAQGGAEPVDPVVVGEDVEDDAGAEGAGGIERA